MSRPPKELTEADLSLIYTARAEGLGFRLVARAVSEERGAFVAPSAKKRRERMVSHQTISNFLERQKTDASKNPAALSEAMTRQQTRRALEVGSTDNQTGVNHD